MCCWFGGTPAKTHSSCYRWSLEWYTTIHLYLSAGTPSETQFINDPLHSLLPFCMCHLRGQTKGCREVEVLPNWKCAHHNIILSAVLESKKRHNRQFTYPARVWLSLWGMYMWYQDSPYAAFTLTHIAHFRWEYSSQCREDTDHQMTVITCTTYPTAHL